MKQVFSAPTPLNREKSNMNLRTMHGVLHVRGVRGGGRREGGKCKEAENHKFLRGPDKSCATFSEMNTLQIFPALILLARVRKTLLAVRPPARQTPVAVAVAVAPPHSALVPYPSSARFYLGLHNAANIMYRKRGQVTVSRLYFMQVEELSVIQR